MLTMAITALCIVIVIRAYNTKLSCCCDARLNLGVSRFNSKHQHWRFGIIMPAIIRAYRKSQTLFRTVPSRPPTASLPQDWGSQPHPKTAIAIISPLKIWDQRAHGHIQGLSNFLVSPIIAGMAKATNFRFFTHTHRGSTIETKAH